MNFKQISFEYEKIPAVTILIERKWVTDPLRLIKIELPKTKAKTYWLLTAWLAAQHTYTQFIF